MKAVTVLLTPDELYALGYVCDRMGALFASGDTGIDDEMHNEQLCRGGESLVVKLRAESR